MKQGSWCAAGVTSRCVSLQGNNRKNIVFCEKCRAQASTLFGRRDEVRPRNRLLTLAARWKAIPCCGAWVQTHQLWTGEVVLGSGNCLCSSAAAELGDISSGRVERLSLRRGCYGDRHDKCRERALSAAPIRDHRGVGVGVKLKVKGSGSGKAGLSGRPAPLPVPPPRLSPAASQKRLSCTSVSMSDVFDRTPGAGRRRGAGWEGTGVRGGAGAPESGDGAPLGGSGSNSSGSADEQQHQVGGLFPQQESLRPPKTAPLGTGIAGTGAAAPSLPLPRSPVSKA